MKIHLLLKEGKDILKALDLNEEEAELETRLILAHLLKIKPLEVYLFDAEISIEVIQKFRNILKRRLSGLPLPYILGEIEFFGRRFFISPGVLIPRAETEILVEAILETIDDDSVWICELGIGSGVVALTLALERNRFKIIGIERSSRAMDIAKKNRVLWGLEKRVKFIQGDWLSPIKKGAFFKAIVSNPPYIAEEEWDSLPEEVRYYEPQEALLAGKEGLDFIKQTLIEAPNYLTHQGLVFLEIGYKQANAVKTLAKKLGYEVSFCQDLLGYQRVVIARLQD